MVGILGVASLTKPPFQNIQLNDKAGICTYIPNLGALY